MGCDEMETQETEALIYTCIKTLDRIILNMRTYCSVQLPRTNSQLETYTGHGREIVVLQEKCIFL